MDKMKRAKLEAQGFWIGDAADFLGLNEYERKLVDYRVRLSIGVREAREAAGLTQAAVAKRIGTTQARIARVEGGERGVTVDLMLKALFAAGGDLSSLPILGPPNKATRPLKRSVISEELTNRSVDEKPPRKKRSTAKA